MTTELWEYEPHCWMLRIGGFQWTFDSKAEALRFLEAYR